MPLAAVYQVIGYYLTHREELDRYLAQRLRDEQEMLAVHKTEWAPEGLRARLVARKTPPG